jgi:acetyl-CoA synthetase
MVRGRHAQRLPPTASTAIWPRAATRRRSSSSPTIPRKPPSTSPTTELHAEVCRFANVLKELGVRKGDRVILYLPMIPEAAYAMLACARIGAIHSIVFAGFSPDALANRINDCDAKVVDHRRRGAARRPQDGAEGQRRQGAPALRRPRQMPGGQAHRRQTTWIADRDVWYDDIARGRLHRPRRRDERRGSALHPLHLRLHRPAQGRGAHHRRLPGLRLDDPRVHFDYHEGDVYWCTADVGWVTGHSYIVYGPLANGATTLMFEGVPTYPDAGRFWEVCDKHKVNQFYTAPTAIRALMGQGERVRHEIRPLQPALLGTVGEPINPEAWNWYNEVVGKGRCPIVDTWWQTETGGT